MAECDTRLPKTWQNNATTFVSIHVNEVIKAGRAKGLQGAALVDHVYEKLGEPITYMFYSDDFNKSGIEKWADGLSKRTVYRPNVEESKYKGVTYNAWDDSANGKDRVLGPTITITDKNNNTFRIGTDKLGHFFQQGYEYWELVVREGKTLEDAKFYGNSTELSQYGLGEDKYGYGENFFWGTGVFSDADLEANLQGYKFYKWLETSGPTSRFTLKDYVSRDWNEEFNVNAYHTDIVKQVWENLLSAQWKGYFTIHKQANNKKIPLTCSMTVTGQKAKSNFKYTHTHGPVTVPFNANISYIPVGLYDFRGIRMDITWRSGDNFGLARLQSLVGAKETEDKLVGTWGWFDSYDNGGTLSLERQ